MNNQIKVSIICNTYNHEKYIREALDSFISQKTNFKYEVLVHDDASTDNTGNIIREYQKLYPELIKPIYQTENQYSKSINITLTYQLPRAKGKYIAMCEGDDYWIDELKLQKQFDALEKMTNINMCSHSANIIDEHTRKVIGHIQPVTKNSILSPNMVIDGGGGYVATNSLFFRKNIFDNIPAFYLTLPLDYTLQILGSLDNGIYFMVDYSSIYRAATPNSWTVRMKANFKASILHNEKVKKMLIQLNKDTSQKYKKAILKMYIKNRLKNIYYNIRRII